jgi:hypothetical protein
VGPRWAGLSAAWSEHIDDAYCSFNDIHAMLAFVGARDWPHAQRLVDRLMYSAAQPTRHGQTTRLLGLDACRALMAYGRGDHLGVVRLLSQLPASAHRLGGSHAQRDVLQLTLQRSLDQLGGPRRHRSAMRGAWLDRRVATQWSGGGIASPVAPLLGEDARSAPYASSPG